MAKQQYGIKNPLTGKEVSISRDARTALVAIEAANVAKQRQLEENILNVSKIITKKTHAGQTTDMVIAVNFDEKSMIDIFSEKTQLKGSLANLPEDVKEIVENALAQYKLCINQALAKKTTDTEANIKRVLEAAQAA